MSADDVTTTSTSSNEGRKSSKPVMEKRRRARINACLVELQSLLADVIKSEGAIKSKMEKADILEMTVRHLRQLQHKASTQGSTLPSTSTLGDASKFRLGYAECINEVSKFLNSIAMEEVELKSRIMDHLATCTTNASNSTSLASKQSSTEMLRPCQLPFQFSQSVLPIQPAVSTLPDSTRSNVTKPNIKIQPKTNVSHTETKTADINIATTNLSASMCSTNVNKSKEGFKTKELFEKQIPGLVSDQENSGNNPQQVAYGDASGKIAADSTSSSQQDFVPVQQVHMPVFSTVQIVPASIGGGDFALVLPTGIVSANTCVFPSPTPQNYILPVFPQPASIVSSSLPYSAPLSSPPTVLKVKESINVLTTSASSTTTDSSTFKAQEQEIFKQEARLKGEKFGSRFHPYNDRKLQLLNNMKPVVSASDTENTLESFSAASQSTSFTRDSAFSISSSTFSPEMSKIYAKSTSKEILKTSQNHDCLTTERESVGAVNDGVVQNQHNQNNEEDMWRPW